MKTINSIPFFRGVSLLIVLNLLIKPVWIFFIDRNVQLAVGHEAYGTYFALLNFSIIFIFLADAGISNLLNQHLAAGVQVNFLQLLKLKAFCLTFYAIACLFAAYLLRITNLEILLYVISIQVLTSLFIFLRSIISAQQLFTADAWMSVVDKILMIVFGGALILGMIGAVSIIAFLQLQLLSTTIALLISSLYLLKQQLIKKASADRYAHLIKKLFPFAAIMLLMSLHYRLDGVLLLKLHNSGEMEAGIYAAAYRLLDAANMVGYLAASFLVPFIARHKHTAELNAVLALVLKMLLYIAVVSVAFLFFYADWVQLQLYHSANTYISSVLQLVIASLPAYYLVHVYGSYFTATRNFRPFIMALIIAVFSNALLNFFLIPDLGAQGAAISAIISQYLCGGVLAFAWIKSAVERIHLFVFAKAVVLLLAFMILYYLVMHALLNIWWSIAVTAILLAYMLMRQIVYFRKKVIYD